MDFDQVTLSSLNRHATALQADVGTPKVDCIARTLNQISRNVRVDSRQKLWRDDEEGAKLLEGADWVIGMSVYVSFRRHGVLKLGTDAIDNITTKVDLLKYCHSHNIKVLPSIQMAMIRLELNFAIDILLNGRGNQV